MSLARRSRSRARRAHACPSRCTPPARAASRAHRRRCRRPAPRRRSSPSPRRRARRRGRCRARPAAPGCSREMLLMRRPTRSRSRGGEARERLVEQQHARARRERERHVEQALPAVGERRPPARSPSPRGPWCASPPRSRRSRSSMPVRVDPEPEAPRVARLHREAHVLLHVERAEEVGDLERAARRPRAVMRSGREARDRPAGERDACPRRDGTCRRSG